MWDELNDIRNELIRASNEAWPLKAYPSSHPKVKTKEERTRELMCEQHITRAKQSYSIAIVLQPMQ